MNKVAAFASRHWKLFLVVLVVAFAVGFQIGKSAAERDHARGAATRV